MPPARPPRASSPRRPLHLLVRGVLGALALAWGSAGGAVGAGSTDPVGVWPLPPQPDVVRRFDPPDTPYAAGHRGVDLLGSPGAAVVATLPGTITFAGRIAGRGVVVVGHGATRTTYEPVTASVAVGQAVGRGAVLGSLEPHGGHCPPRVCLHWGWVAGDTYLDPLRLVGAGPVRLLPLWRATPAGAASVPPPPPAPAPATGWPGPVLRPVGAPGGRQPAAAPT